MVVVVVVVVIVIITVLMFSNKLSCGGRESRKT
jgi:hypothetical protein